jgi:23S rRNA maturation-related 3'-5' exoribonuclease YhaM
MENKQNRCVKKSFRFTENEWLLIEKKCADANITPTQYFQQIAISGKTAKKDCLQEQKKYLGEIAIIGSGVNQIARKLNSDEKVDLWMLYLLLKIEKYLNKKLLL